MQKRTIRLISAVITLVCLFSFVTPALAVSDMNPPVWERKGYASLEEFMDAYWFESEEEYQEYIDFYRDFYEWCDDYIARNPNYLQEASDFSNSWYANYYASKEDMMEEFGYTEEEFDKMLIEDYLWDMYYTELEEREKAEARVSMGGTPEGLGVMFMGEYVKFADAQPELNNNRTMIPVRAVMEFLGAKVDYNTENMGVSIILENGDTVYFEIGSAKVTLKSGDDEKTMQMDVAPYVSENRTYVPLRFFSEILGYDVFWDAYYFTAVVIDRDKLVSELDAKLTTINEILFAQNADPEKTYKSTADMNIEITMLDSINGDKSTKMSAAITTITDGTTVDISGKLDIAELITLIEASLGENLEGIDRNMFKNADFDLIMNTAKGLMFLRSSLIAALNESVTADTWLKDSFEVTDVASIMTLGELIYSMNSEYNAIFLAQSFNETADAIVKILGDDKFTASGTDKKLTLTMEDAVSAFYDDEYITNYYAELVNALDFEVVISKNNGISGFVKMDLVADDEYTPQILFSMDFSSNKTDASVTMELHVKNTLKAALTIKAKTAETTEKPRTEPPAGAKIIDESTGAGLVPEQPTLSDFLSELSY